VQTARDFAHTFAQARLHVHVDILEGCVEGELARLDLLADGEQTLHERFHVRFRDQAHPAEHAGVCDRASNVVARQGAVEVDRRRKSLHRGIGGVAEPAAPGFLCGHGRKPWESQGIRQG
jgi:hypothetical protein